MTYDDETPLDVLRERLYDAIQTAMWAHESEDRDSHCTCGVRNNMDGDVLAGHRVGAVAAAAWAVIEALGLTEETRTNVMSSAGQTTNILTGITTHRMDIRHDRRLVTHWETS